MKYQITFLFLLIASVLQLTAQNLVPNPSFEEFDVCPPNTSINSLGIPRLRDYIKFWEDADLNVGGASSDFFHTCADTYNSNIGSATGNGHLGGFTYTSNNYREYVQVPLKTALCNGRTYRVRLKLASSRAARRNTDRIGVYFSNGRFTPPNFESVSLTPQVETPVGQFINNETRWREFTMTFTNNGGGEDHLTIGNFRSNANTNSTGNTNAYIYMDDVFVEDITPALTISGGTINDTTCGASDGGVTGLSVSGGSGSYTYRWTDEDGNEIATDLNPSNLPTGIYELLISDGGNCEELANRTFTINDNCPEPCPRTNLAPNPGFEEIRRCPNQRSLNRNDLGRNVRDWYSPNDGLPTLYNQCARGSAFMSGTPSAYPGQGFVGFYTYYYAAEYGDDRKEYVQAQLTSPMVAGESYTVEFNVRLRVAMNYATDQMGVYFSNNALTINGSDGELGVTPSLKTPAGTYFTDTDNWQTVTFSSPYVATGGEEYITIGKFEDVANTTFQDLMPGRGNAEAFYFLDNVIVEPISGATGRVDSGADQTINLGDSASLSALPSSGTPTYIWTASPADASLSGQETDQDPSVMPTQTTTYTVTADFGGGCSDTDQVVVTVNSTPCLDTVDAGADQTINLGDSASLSALPSSGTPTYTWTASPSDTTLSGQENTQNPTVSLTATTTYTVTADFGGGCTDTDTVTVTVDAPPVSCTGTNLVPNPSFENLSGCPRGNSFFEQTIRFDEHYSQFVDDWVNVSGSTTDPTDGDVNSSPDVYNSCCNNCPVDVPLNDVLGNLVNPLAPDGEGYAGLILMDSFNTPNYREYIAARLNENIEVGETYIIEFKWRVKNLNGTAFTNRFGAYFSQGIPSNFRDTNANSPGILDVVPQVEYPTNQFLDNTDQWVQFSQTFVANNAADHIILGSFHNDAETATANSSGLRMFLFVDEVSVRKSTSSNTVDAGPDIIINQGQSTILTGTPSGGTPTYSWTASPADPSLLGQESTQNPTVSPTQTTTYTVTADFGGGCTATDTVMVTVDAPPVSCVGPNLVPGGDFETYIQCPTNSIFFPFETISDYLQGWSAPTDGSPDYFNTCDFTSIAMPANGNGFGGLFLKNGGDSREYYQIELASPLVAGETYAIDFNLLKSTVAFSGGCIISEVGFYFTNAPISMTGFFDPLPVTPQVTTPPGEFYPDSNNWQAASTIYFTASGGETHVIIGNFADDASTVCQNTTNNILGYYFLDDISISGTSGSNSVDAGADQTINTGDMAFLTATPNAGTPAYTWSANPADTSLSGQENTQNPTVSPTQTTSYTVTADFGGGCTDTDTVMVTVDTSSSCSGTNLVPNPSFEDITNCPDGISGFDDDQLDNVENWDNLSIGGFSQGTSDLYNSCCTNCNVDVPFLTTSGVNINPNAYDGQGYAALIPFNNNLTNYREYITAQLSGNLETGKTYEVQFRWRSRYQQTKFFVNRLGAYFSAGRPTQFVGTSRVLDASPQVEFNTGQFLNETNDWMLFTATFVATGSENQITIGNFYDDAQTNTQATGYNEFTLADIAYIFIDQVIVRETGSQNIDAGLDITIDVGDTAGLSATPNTGSPTYSWTASPSDSSLGGQETAQSPNVSPTQTTTYTVTADFGGGCTATDTVTILVGGCPLVVDETSLLIIDADCGQVNGSITGLVVSGNSGSETYSWVDAMGNVVGTSVDLMAVGLGTYMLTVTDGIACNISVTYIVNERGASQLDSDDVQFVDAGCGQTNGSISGITYSGTTTGTVFTWTDENGAAVGSSLELNNITAGVYMLNATDTAGCGAVAGPFLIESLDCEQPDGNGLVRIANMVTPNGDGANDTFIIEGLANYPKSMLHIYNRWGSKLYQARAYDNSWNGTFEGGPLPVATYYYILQLNNVDKKIMKGTVTILR